MVSNFTKYFQLDKHGEYVIFDIGSRDCEQSIEFYHAFPRSKIYAFECNPNTLEICRKNIEPYKDRITLIEGAVCHYDGEITFYPINQQKTITSWADGNPGASSLFKSNGTYTMEMYVQDEIKTHCHRLDTIMRRHNIPNVDIIWMDLQGAELLALKGLGEHINSLQYVYTEVSHREIYTGQVMFKELDDFMQKNNFILKNNLKYTGWQEDAVYEKNSMANFDIVIPIGPKDTSKFQLQLQYTKKNIIGYRNIYLVCYDPTINFEGCITVDERIFPFNIHTVSSFHGSMERNSWYLQQLLKLYAGIVIPGILERYLVLDADTFFMKPVTFIHDGKCLYNYGTEYHQPYFMHVARLDIGVHRSTPNMSGICHHMMFETKYVKELFETVEKKHGDTFYNMFLKLVDKDHYSRSGASEYEIYFNYMLIKHPDKIVIRKLNWCNSKYLSEDYDYVTWHSYLDLLQN